MTAAPRQNPRSTPAAVETMLDGTGRTTSRASKLKIDAATTHRPVPLLVTRSENALNCASKRKNGTSTSAISALQTIAHRIRSGYQTDASELERQTATRQRPTDKARDGRSGATCLTTLPVPSWRRGRTSSNQGEERILMKIAVFRVGVAAALLTMGYMAGRFDGAVPVAQAAQSGRVFELRTYTTNEGR